MKSSALRRALELPFHPLVFVVFPVISLYASNLGKGYLGEAVTIAAGLVAIVAVLWLVLYLLTKQVSASAIILSAFVVLFFSLGHVISAVDTILEKLQLSAQTQFLVKGEISLIIWLSIGALLLFCIARYALKRTGQLHNATQFLNIVALALFVISGLNLVFNGVKSFGVTRFLAEMDGSVPQASSEGHEDSTADDSFNSPVPVEVEAPGEGDSVRGFIDSWRQNAPSEDVAVPSPAPDIYYIIVDAYARQDILQEVFGYDDSEFINYLVDRGFFVTSDSSANYPQTALSLSSSLNMEYLDDAVNKIGTDTSDRSPLSVMIKESRVFGLLRNSGYKLVAFDSGYDPTCITEADEYLSPPKWSPSPFQEAFVMLTPLSVFDRTLIDFRRQRILYAFDHLPDAAEHEEPTIVFLHVLIPHFPFIFDEKGRPTEPSKGVGGREDYDYEEYIEGYSNQLAFTSKKLMSAVDAILSQSSTPPIIIIQSDHGPSAHLEPSWSYGDHNLSERLSIFNAYYFPDQDYTGLYEAITPVNTFRVVLNQFFGTDYELMDDRSYWATWERPYDPTDVTEELKREE